MSAAAGSVADLARILEVLVEGVVSGLRIDDLLVDDVSECFGFALDLGRTSWAPHTGF